MRCRGSVPPSTMRMEAFRNRPLEGEYPYVWLDATVVKVREGGRVVNMAAVVAVGVTGTGEREILGFDVGPAESYGFWVSFLRGIVARGLAGVKLVISDAHVGLNQALSEVLAGASRQRCRVHFMRNPTGTGPAGSAGVRGDVGADRSSPSLAKRQRGSSWSWWRGAWRGTTPRRRTFSGKRERT